MLRYSNRHLRRVACAICAEARRTYRLLREFAHNGYELSATGWTGRPKSTPLHWLELEPRNRMQARIGGGRVGFVAACGSK
jgi:hypothetical protein